MRNKLRIIPVVFLLLIIVLSGCSMKSEEEALTDAKQNALEAFNNKEKIETNHELNSFELYLPENLEVKEESKSNVILEDGDQTYIVFYNNLEKPTSQLSYESAKKEEALLMESFKDNNKFGYIRILSDKGDGYEMQVGIGGVKITTYTSKGKMDNDARALMEISRSIAATSEVAQK
ncbi:hypothetical protein [Virgibacillus oceani]|uniref:Uncharacterized protein n=1 Tax=Virgibacillus oceani TaxID=1479511 RepID=A0A917HPH0_9BACI|nr:hypothetical protein [Virgibacillus oceani]GGG84967.1 hypothetical protein GCM10011398_33350 [Virgibacillus oceani]